jgi:hypothetical protein
MPRKNRHPEREILEFVNGSLAAPARQEVEAHLLVCNKCAAAAAVVGALKSQVSSRARSNPNLGADQSLDMGPVGNGLLISGVTAARGGGSEQSSPGPSARKDLEFRDLLLQDSSVSRPMLGAASGSAHPPPQHGAGDLSSHLDTGELASFFYGELSREAAAAAARHVAVCSDCSDAISIFSDSEAAAQVTGESTQGSGAMSEESWKLIKDWEENCLAEPRPECETVSREMLERFVEILREHREEIDRVAGGPSVNQALNPGIPQIVPVVVLDPAGGFRGVEAFHRLPRRRGLEALQCQAPPDRFNDLPIHALLGSDRQYPMVVSGRINGGMAELDYSSIQLGLIQPLGYFIVEN